MSAMESASRLRWVSPRPAAGWTGAASALSRGRVSGSTAPSGWNSDSCSVSQSWGACQANVLPQPEQGKRVAGSVWMCLQAGHLTFMGAR